jgi:hypothetical protein
VGDYAWVPNGGKFQWKQLDFHRPCEDHQSGSVHFVGGMNKSTYGNCDSNDELRDLVFLPASVIFNGNNVTGDELLHLYTSVIDPLFYCQVKMCQLIFQKVTSVITHCVPTFDVNVLQFVLFDYLDYVNISEMFQKSPESGQ